MCFINKFICFCKIIGFTKQIYEYKSLSQNHIFIFKILSLTTFIFLLLILWSFVKIISCLKYVRNKFRQQ